MLSRAVGFIATLEAGAYSICMIGADLFQLQGRWHNVSMLHHDPQVAGFKCRGLDETSVLMHTNDA
jgi:hypothetical protein